nr:hypothetical protein L203_01294 [Cryptococcus depauperatus CBS 7841]
MIFTTDEEKEYLPSKVPPASHRGIPDRQPMQTCSRKTLAASQVCDKVTLALVLNAFIVVFCGCCIVFAALPEKPLDVSQIEWLYEQIPILEKRILKNIGPVLGADSGIVVASPSTGQGEEPNYYYTWTRDSALTIATLVTSLQSPFCDIDSLKTSCEGKCDTYRREINILSEDLQRRYIESQARIQIQRNPSGGLADGGLNEPKFNVDGGTFLGNWGRPQRDGPALRAITTMAYANFLLQRNYSSDLKYIDDWIYSPTRIRSPGRVLKNDLEEIANGWWKGGFDLWEEVDGHHLFTLLVSRRALFEGSDLAERLNDLGASRFYLHQAQLITNSLSVFWDQGRDVWASSLDYNNYTPVHQSVELPSVVSLFPRREWLDCSFALSIIHGGSQTFYDSHNISNQHFLPSDPRTLSTLHAFIKSFQSLYGVNSGKTWTEGWALGRYKEDIYDGKAQSRGNPWFICTFSLAHSLFLAHQEINNVGIIRITAESWEFWHDIVNPSSGDIHNQQQYKQTIIMSLICRVLNRSSSRSSEKVVIGDEWAKGERRFAVALKHLWQVAEGFVEVGKQVYENNGGSMSEQFGRCVRRLYYLEHIQRYD